MNNLAIIRKTLPVMSNEAIDKVRLLEVFTLKMPQVEILTQHVLHGGMYARTIKIPAGVLLTGVVIKIATVLIIQGDVTVYIGDDTIELKGYNVLPASANRKQVFLAKTDVWMTMLFPSNAKSSDAAEDEFTDEAHNLISRKHQETNQITITGE